MTDLAVLIALTLMLVAGLVLAGSAWLQPAPPLSRVLDHLQRSGEQHSIHALNPRRVSAQRARRFEEQLGGLARRYPRLVPSSADLALVGRPVERHVGWLLLSMVAGFVVPAIIVGSFQAAGLLGLRWFVPALAAAGAAVLCPMLVHTTTVERAATIRADLRYQVSAYLDVVTMLLAGNTGFEGALEQAAHAGDGQLFAELKRRIRESGARGTSLTDALRRTGAELGLDELVQIAATASLSAAEGAPVARTLAAKCATLRSALATEQESEARLRTSRLTSPIVGMALIFMALVMYPALSFSL